MDAVDYYNTIKDSYEALYSMEQEGKIDFLISLVKPKRKHLILDVGAGSGILERKLKKEKIIALEPSKLIDDLAENKPKNITIIRKRILDFHTTKKFDIIFCVTVLQDMKPSERQEALDSLFKMCKKGGKIVISVLGESNIDLSSLHPDKSGEIENDRYYIFEN
ncbi:MAG: class I SAM-dependent methyltransferase [Candidatus Parvarchaeota archaeon]|nr:class I SAM-dependent methyltransferase [Candidatus Parvarchaeota archaeon]